MDNARGGKCEARRRAGKVMRSKLGPPRVADVPQIFDTEVHHERATVLSLFLPASWPDEGERGGKRGRRFAHGRTGVLRVVRPVVCRHDAVP